MCCAARSVGRGAMTQRVLLKSRGQLVYAIRCLHAPRLPRPAGVAERDPVSNRASGVLLAFEAVRLIRFLPIGAVGANSTWCCFSVPVTGLYTSCARADQLCVVVLQPLNLLLRIWHSHPTSAGDRRERVDWREAGVQQDAGRHQATAANAGATINDRAQAARNVVVELTRQRLERGTEAGTPRSAVGNSRNRMPARWTWCASSRRPSSTLSDASSNDMTCRTPAPARSAKRSVMYSPATGFAITARNPLPMFSTI
jgi:hypothetical protein